MEAAATGVLSALSLAAILALVAMGMAIVFGLMGVINLAHGEFVTIGAYTAALTASTIGSFWIGLILAPCIGAVAGLALETSIIRHLYRRPLDTILATLGLSFVVQKSLEFAFGSSPIGLANPLPGLVEIFGTSYPWYRVFLIAFAVLVVVIVAIVYRRTRIGLDLRAAIQNQEMAQALGVNVAQTYRVAFVAGAALASLAGALIAPVMSIYPGMGLPYLIKSFFVVIVGGTGGIAGVIAGSAFIGAFETAFAVAIGGAFPQALVLVLAIVLVRFRPRGLVPA